MGCVNGSEQTVEVHHPHINRVQCSITQYLQIMRLEHPLNINKKYEHICKLIPTESAGEGCRKVRQQVRKTVAYECLVTQAEFEMKRKEFWETRTSGDKQNWGAIELALESENEAGVRAILESAGLRMLNNSIQMCIDEKIAKYEVPVFCVNMPKSFSQKSTAQANLDMNFQNKTVSVKIRSTKFITDTVVSMETSTTIASVKETYKNHNKAPNCKIRLFYRGREMLDQFKLGNYGFREGEVITAMVIV